MLVVLRSHNFVSAEQAAAFLGVVPIEKRSGTSVRRRFMMNIIMNAVTNLILRSGPVAKRWELSLVLPNRRDRLVAARAGILPSRSTMQAMNRLWVYRIY